MHAQLLAATYPDAVTFAIAALIVLGGAFGVVLSKNPIHAALMLVLTLFGIAVLFVEEDAQFLAVVQVIVYTGAIVVLFLFVIMLLGVDRRESVLAESFRGQRFIALGLGACVLAEVLLLATGHWSTGAHGVTAKVTSSGSNVEQLGRALFTSDLLPFEVTSALLVVAVIGAVVLARRADSQQSREVEIGDRERRANEVRDLERERLAAEEELGAPAETETPLAGAQASKNEEVPSR